MESPAVVVTNKAFALMFKGPPGLWQRSRFVPLKGRKYIEAEVERHQEREARTIRGPGKVGSPECNVVCTFDKGTDDAIIDQFIILHNMLWGYLGIQEDFEEHLAEVRSQFEAQYEKP